MTDILTIIGQKEDKLDLYYRRRGEEIIELLDERGEKSGEKFVRKKGCLPPKGKFFAVVEAWVRVANSKLLLIQRHPNKDFGLEWECPGGTVRLGETPIEAVKRELHEETRIDAPYEKFTYLGVTQNNNWFCYSYLLDVGKDIEQIIELQDIEVVAYKFVDIGAMEDYLDMLTKGHRGTYLKYRDQINSVS